MRGAHVLIALAFAALAAIPSGASHAKAPARPSVSKRPPNASRVWHTATPGKSAPVDDSGRAMLVLQGLNHTESVALPAHGERGGFDALDLDRAAHVLRETSTGNEHPVDPRVLDVVYRIQVRFGAHEVRVVSGYRTPRRGRISNHGRGRAIDLVVPGASDEEVAKFAREQGFVGVGVYPVSGFVHVDVRERSYFWVDTSGPGKRSRTRGILADLAARSDARALARGERSAAPFTLSDDVEAAIAKSSAAASPSSAAIDEEDTDVEGADP